MRMQQNICIENIHSHKQFKQFFWFQTFSNKMAKRTLGRKALTVVKKLGHKSTAVLSKIGSKAVDVASSKAANYLVGAAASALL